jgi:hypothetical protein
MNIIHRWLLAAGLFFAFSSFGIYIFALIYFHPLPDTNTCVEYSIENNACDDYCGCMLCSSFDREICISENDHKLCDSQTVHLSDDCIQYQANLNLCIALIAITLTASGVIAIIFVILRIKN